jgi:tetratricopeptide (TPR) repeat protein
MISVKIQCACGQKYAFDVEPLNGRMPGHIQCPVCGVDGTNAANEIITRTLAAQAPVKTGLRVSAESPAPPARTAPIPSPVQANYKPRRKKTGVVLAGVVLLLVAGAAVGFLAWQNSQRDAALDPSGRGSDSDAGKPDPNWPQTLAEVNATYAEPPAGQNAATVFLQAFDAIKISESDKKSPNLPLIGKMTMPRPNEPFKSLSKKEIGDFVKRNSKAIELLHSAAQLSGSRYPADFSLGFETRLPHLSKIKTASQVLVLFTIWNAESKKPNEVGNGIHTLLQLARSLEMEPTLISQLVRIAAISQAHTALEQGINRVALPPATLERLQTAFDSAANQEAAGVPFTRSLTATYASSRSFFDLSPDELVNMFSTNKALGDSLFKTAEEREKVLATLKKNAKADREFFVETLKQIMSARTEPFPARLKEAELSKARAAQAITNQLTLSSMFLKSSGVDREASGVAVLKLAQTAIALERFRSGNANRYPESMNLLVPTLLSEMPVDPFDGEPLRYQTKGAGYVLYSIAQDKADDLGKKLEKGKGDLVFTVVNPAKAIPGSSSSPASKPNKFDAVLASAREHISNQRTNEAVILLQRILEDSDADANALLTVAREFMKISDLEGLEKTLQRMVQVVPENAEAWYDLAGLQSLRNKKAAAIDSLIKALELSDARLRDNPAARDLRTEMSKDHRFKALLDEPKLGQARSQL